MWAPALESRVSSRAPLLLVWIVLVAPFPAAAQDTLVRAALDSGALVRVHPVSGATVRGRLVAPLAPSGDTIALCQGRAAHCNDPGDSTAIRRIPTASVSRIEVAHGTQSATGAAIGGATGLAFGLLAGAATDACVVSDCGGPSAGAILGVSVVVFALLGALVGSSFPAWGPP
jgi:hypothetical protein